MSLFTRQCIRFNYLALIDYISAQHIILCPSPLLLHCCWIQSGDMLSLIEYKEMSCDLYLSSGSKRAWMFDLTSYIPLFQERRTIPLYSLFIYPCSGTKECGAYLNLAIRLQWSHRRELLDLSAKEKVVYLAHRDLRVPYDTAH